MSNLEVYDEFYLIVLNLYQEGSYAFSLQPSDQDSPISRDVEFLELSSFLHLQFSISFFFALFPLEAFSYFDLLIVIVVEHLPSFPLISIHLSFLFEGFEYYHFCEIRKSSRRTLIQEALFLHSHLFYSPPSECFQVQAKQNN